MNTKKHGRAAERDASDSNRDEQDPKRHPHRGESAPSCVEEAPDRGESTESWIPRPPSDS
jgi:hypothetical protein